MLRSILNSRWGKTVSLMIVSTLFSLAFGWAIFGNVNAVWLWPTVIIPMMVSAPIGYFIFGREQQIHSLNQELSRQLAEDPLTGAMSRRGFFALFKNNVTSSDSIFMIVDLDHFKAVNDTYGHVAGDAVLRHAVMAMGRVIGDMGHVARLGGEEFAIWLPDMDPLAGRRVATAICTAVACETIDWDGQRISVTASTGASFVRQNQSLELALSKADAALYRAKSGGRDRSEFHDCTRERHARDRVIAGRDTPVPVANLA